MFTIPWDLGAGLYVMITCTGLFVLWFWYDRRDRSLYEAQRRKTVFHCVKCDHVYTGTKGSFVKSCPRCQFRNHHLTF